MVFGVLWAWLGAGEAPSIAVLGGGMLVIGALAGNELLSLRRPRAGLKAARLRQAVPASACTAAGSTPSLAAAARISCQVVPSTGTPCAVRSAR